MTSPGDLRLNVLGPLRIEVDGIHVPIAGRLKHRLISRLALHPGQAISTDVLIDALWGDDAPRTAKQSLHVHISHIRDRLRTVGAERLVTTTLDGLYVLANERLVIDATLFESLIDQGLTALQVSNLRSARDQLRDAMSMWGDPFESLANDYGAMAQRQRLITVYERGADAYTATLIDLGETDEATALLRSAVATEPLREHPYEQLMRIHLGRGERARAIEVYEQAAQVFDTQLGVEPSQTLRELRDSVTDPQAPARSSAASSSPRRHTPQVDSPTSVLNWDTNLEVDIGQSAMFEVALDRDAGPFVEAVRASAALSGRRVAHGRVTQGATSPLSPIFELAGFDAEPGTSRSPQLRAQLFDRISHRLVQQHFLVPILLLEGIENASVLLLEYLSHALGRPGPPPFTVLLVGTDLADLQLPGPLADAVTQRASLELAAVRVPSLEGAFFDDTERSVLMLLSCASLPAATELIARASDRSAADMAAAVDRLAARRVVVVDADGRLSLTRTSDTVDQLDARPEERAAAHQALAAAIGHGDTASDPRRTVARTHHLMHSLDTTDWTEASESLRASVDYLESLSAYDDIVELCHSGGDPESWPDGDHTLALLVALGRAQMRIGHTDDGRGTLERCLDLARSGKHGHWFGEALRALLEERAPQTLEAAARTLIDEALCFLPEEATETRVQLLTDMANSWYFSDPNQAALWADRALELARDGAPSTLARGITGVIQAKLRPDNAAERLDLALEAQHWARRADSTETLVLALTYEANALMELGELRRAGPPLRYAEALASEVQVPRFRWWAAAWAALLDFALGDLTSAEEGFMAAYELWPTSSSFDPFECLASQLAALRFVQGRGAELLPVLADLSGEDARIEYLAPAALAYAQAGDIEHAHLLLERLLEPEGIASRYDTVVPFALALAAETAFRIDAAEHAPALIKMLEPLIDVHATLNVWGGGGFYWGSLRHGYGLMLALGGNHAGARQELEHAANSQAAAGSVLFAERSRDVWRSLSA